MATHRWYRLESVVRAAFGAAEGVSLAPSADGRTLPRLTYDVRYFDGAAVRTLTRTASLSIMSLGLDGRTDSGAAYNVPYTGTTLTLPDWSGAETVERAFALTGWRLSARYAAYPSTDIEVEVLPGTWPDPDADGLPALDGRDAEGGYTRRAERSTTSLALRHGGALAPSTPGVTMLRDSGSTFYASYLPAPPPAWGNLALTRWAFEQDRRGPDALRDEPTPDADEAEGTGFTLPAVGWADNPITPLLGAYTNAVGAYSESVAFGLPLVRGAGPFDAAPAATECYLGVVLRGVPGVPHNALLFAREPALPTAADEAPLVNEAWAGPSYQRRRLAEEVEVADGDFYVHDTPDETIDFRVGDALRGVALEGRAWLVREQARDLDDDRTSMTLVRPSDGGAGGTAVDVPALPVVTGAVGALSARLERTEVDGLPDLDFVTVEWAPPPVRASAFVRYEIQTRLPGTDAWRPWGETFATAYRFLRPAPGGDPIDSLGVRVRAVRGLAALYAAGPWAVVTADLTTVTNES